MFLIKYLEENVLEIKGKVTIKVIIKKENLNWKSSESQKDKRKQHCRLSITLHKY